MRYEKGHRDDTRRRIVEAASRRLRKDGIASTGIASLMAEAGLTHGGFYAHFTGKEALVNDAVCLALQGTRRALVSAVKKAHEEGRDGFEAIVDRYLNRAHRDHPEAGCAAASLAAELARAQAGAREGLAQEVHETLSVIAAEIRGRSPDAAYAAACAVFGLLMGTLQLARVIGGPETSAAMLAAGREAALTLAQPRGE
jgi:TetR/AcrR family transcriptional regulator, transcriptional repressor for nem operon